VGVRTFSTNAQARSTIQPSAFFHERIESRASTASWRQNPRKSPYGLVGGGRNKYVNSQWLHLIAIIGPTPDSFLSHGGGRRMVKIYLLPFNEPSESRSFEKRWSWPESKPTGAVSSDSDGYQFLPAGTGPSEIVVRLSRQREELLGTDDFD
jgi:hypothetical protein